MRDLRDMRVEIVSRPGSMLGLSLAAILGVAAAVLPIPSAAQNLPNTYRGSATSSVCAASAATCENMSFSPARPTVSGEVRWAGGLLYGEPVLDMRLSWDPGTITNHLKPVYAAADPMLRVLSAESDAAQELRLYEARARLTVTFNNASYSLDADLGVPGRPGGEESYNVAGSPDWSRLFRDRDGNYVAAERAKEIFLSGALETASAQITQARVDTSKFEEWWLNKNVERYAGPLRDAIDARLDALSEAFDLPTFDLRSEIAALGPGLAGRALIGKLEEILFKLSPDRIPAKFMGEGPDKLWRLKTYADRISGTEARLREATEALPPMPGSSAAYDTWRDQIGIRLTQDAERLARLQGLQDEADRLARELEEERQRLEAKARAAEERERRRREAEERRQDEERSRREASYMSTEPHSWGGSLSDSFEASSWGYDSYRFNPSYWTADGYMSSGGGGRCAEEHAAMNEAKSEELSGGGSYETSMQATISAVNCFNGN